MATPIDDAYDALVGALRARHPSLLAELRAAIPFARPDWADLPGAEELLRLWERTSGQPESPLGVVGGLRLLGPADAEIERAKWRELLDGDSLSSVAHPPWDQSTSLHPNAVRGVLFAAGWIPVLCEPLEANYLAVDLVPLAGGAPGQVILCGRDEDEKCVIARGLSDLFVMLADDCARGEWSIERGKSRAGAFEYVRDRRGRLLSVLKRRAMAAAAAS